MQWEISNFDRATNTHTKRKITWVLAPMSSVMKL